MKGVVLLVLFALLQAPAGKERATALNNEGVRLLREERYDAAIRKFVEARAADPESALIRENLASAHARRGLHRDAQGEKGAALEDLRAAIRLDPGRGAYRLALAQLLYRSGDLGPAEEALRAALACKAEEDAPLRGACRRLLGNVLYLQDRLEDALDAFEELLRLDPKDEQAARMKEKIQREIRIQRVYRRDVTTHFNLFYPSPAAEPGVKGIILSMLEEEWSRVCSDLNTYPRTRVTVIVYRPEDFKAVTRADAWVGGLFDRKIRIPLPKGKEEDPLVRETLRHEFTHFVVYSVTPSCPAWINEGLATYEQYGPGRGKARLQVLLKKGAKPVPFASLPESFLQISDAARVRLCYVQSQAMTEYLVASFGMGRMMLFLRNLSGARDWKAAFREAYGREFRLVEADWRAGLKE